MRSLEAQALESRAQALKARPSQAQTSLCSIGRCPDHVQVAAVAGAVTVGIGALSSVTCWVGFKVDSVAVFVVAAIAAKAVKGASDVLVEGKWHTCQKA